MNCVTITTSSEDEDEVAERVGCNGPLMSERLVVSSSSSSSTVEVLNEIE